VQGQRHLWSVKRRDIVIGFSSGRPSNTSTFTTWGVINMCDNASEADKQAWRDRCRAHARSLFEEPKSA
jgi:hypothetical protein